VRCRSLAAFGIAIIGFGLPTNGVEAATTTATTAIVVLSLVVVTGYAGSSRSRSSRSRARAPGSRRLVVNYDFPSSWRP
jgi:hypothetical protein